MPAKKPLLSVFIFFVTTCFLVRTGNALTLTGTPPTHLAVGQHFAFSPTVSHVVVRSLSYSVQNRPAWLSVSPKTGYLYGTPRAAGVYSNIRLVARDENGSASLSFSIDVGSGTRSISSRGRLLTISGTPAASVSPGAYYSFKPTVIAYSGAKLNFQIMNKPSWASFSTSSGLLAGTPSAGNAAKYSNVDIGVTDGMTGAALPAFSITVTGGTGSTGSSGGSSGGGTSADANAPGVSITSPTSAASYATSSSSVSLAGSASDNVGVKQVSWSNNQGGSGIANGTSSWSIPSISLASGTNLITVSAKDAAGNGSSKTLSISYTAAPVAGSGSTSSGSGTGSSTGSSSGTAYYLSPSGNDSNPGTSASPWKSFAAAASKMKAGQTLILLDGTYASGNDWQGSGDGQVPSGSSRNAPTVVRAANPGKVHVRSLFVGRSTRKDSYITFQDLTFDTGCMLYNSSFITLKNVGCHGGIDVGNNDGEWGNTDNLIEDVWVWATGQRVIAINYRADRNVWRRVIVRGDGCGTADCAGSGNPNVGFTIYDSSDVSAQNVMVLDRVLSGSDSGYADFACAQHTSGAHLYGRNQWLGIVSLNAPDSGMYCEPDNVISGVTTGTITNAVVWNAADEGINLSRAGTYVLKNATVKAAGDGVRLSPDLSSGTVSGILVMGAGRYGINSVIAPTNSIVAAGGFNQTTCAGCSTTAPSLTSIVQSPVSGIGAVVVNRYGVDGTHFNDSGYNTQSSTALWPWPNEARIKAEMCTSTSRGFCSTASRADGSGPVTVTSYIWEHLGSPLPSSIAP